MEKMPMRRIKKKQWKRAKLVPASSPVILTEQELHKAEHLAREKYPADYATFEKYLQRARDIRLRRQQRVKKLRAEVRKTGAAMNTEQRGLLTKQRHAIRRELLEEIKELRRMEDPRSYDAKIKFYLGIVDYLQCGTGRETIEELDQAQILSVKYIDLIRDLMQRRVRMLARIAKKEGSDGNASS